MLKASLQNLKKIHTHAKLNKDQHIRKLVFPKIKISVCFSPGFPVALLPTLCKPLQCVLPLCHNLLHVFCCQNILLLLILTSYFIKCTLLLLALLSFAIRTCINSDHSLVSFFFLHFCPAAGSVLAAMAPRLSACTRSDMVWQRVCWKLLENVPQRWMESVLTGLVQAVSG